MVEVSIEQQKKRDSWGEIIENDSAILKKLIMLRPVAERHRRFQFRDFSENVSCEIELLPLLFRLPCYSWPIQRKLKSAS